MLIILFLFCMAYKYGSAQSIDSNVIGRIIQRENKLVVQAVDNSTKAIDNQTKLLRDSVVSVIKNGDAPWLKAN